MNAPNPIQEEIRLLRKEAAAVDRSDRRRIATYGPDRVSFIQALFTNDVSTVGSGHLVYGFFLTNKGRLAADARILSLGEALLLDVEPQLGEPVMAYLDKYHFTEKVELADESTAIRCIGLFGPKAPAAFEFLFGGKTLPAEGTVTTLPFETRSITAAGNGLTGEPGCDLYVAAEDFDAVWSKLTSTAFKPIGREALELARIEAGVPRFGAELTEDTIPLEAGLGPVGISFTKGCYVGQEVIARIDSRGEPARRLVGFSVEGPLPAVGAPIRQGDREVGKVMSAVVSESLRGRPIAMGYVHKSVSERAEDLYAGDAHLWIVPRPFYPPKH